MNYVIGDTHGNFDTLLALVKRLPKDASLIFVGDLVDRGEQSEEVVRFVRENGHQCVLGNHEEMMVTYSDDLFEAYEHETPLLLYNVWCSNGGIDTLLSYGVITLEEGRPEKVTEVARSLETLKDDIRWMESLPLYIELDVEHLSGKPVVLSHAVVADVWYMRDIDSMSGTFSEMANTNRRDPDKDAKVFNIFGHTPVRWGVEVQPHFVNVDTGCYLGRDGYGQLSAYCVETGETVSVSYVSPGES